MTKSLLNILNSVLHTIGSATARSTETAVATMRDLAESTPSAITDEVVRPVIGILSERVTRDRIPVMQSAAELVCDVARANAKLVAPYIDTLLGIMETGRGIQDTIYNPLSRAVYLVAEAGLIMTESTCDGIFRAFIHILELGGNPMPLLNALDAISRKAPEALKPILPDLSYLVTTSADYGEYYRKKVLIIIQNVLLNTRFEFVIWEPVIPNIVESLKFSDAKQAPKHRAFVRQLLRNFLNIFGSQVNKFLALTGDKQQDKILGEIKLK